jgi:hypothetical protein
LIRWTVYVYIRYYPTTKTHFLLGSLSDILSNIIDEQFDLPPGARNITQPHTSKTALIPGAPRPIFHIAGAVHLILLIFWVTLGADPHDSPCQNKSPLRPRSVPSPGRWYAFEKS